MKYHVVINACVENPIKQTQEIRGFIRQYCSKENAGNTIVFVTKEQKQKEVFEVALTPSVIFITLEYYQTETIVHILENYLVPQDIYLFSSDFAGNELAVRTAKRMGGSSINNGRDLFIEQNQVYVSKMVYSGHMQGTFLLPQGPYCISLAKGIWQEECEDKTYENLRVTRQCNQEQISFVEERKFEAEFKEKKLEDAKFAVIAGRGVQKREAIGELRELVKRLHGEIGVSRPVAMSAWAPMNQLVGVSGVMLKPEICIVAGASGAPALYAGIDKSKFIIAINTDEKAPIMKSADVVIIDDCHAIMKALVQCVEEGVCNE
ncbi:MAG: FAD-binding protein [Lachnospiraceae bacterium]